MSRPQTARWSHDRQVVHMEPSAHALGLALWLAVLVAVAALLGVSWGWLMSGGLLVLTRGIGGAQ